MERTRGGRGERLSDQRTPAVPAIWSRSWPALARCRCEKANPVMNDTKETTMNDFTNFTPIGDAPRADHQHSADTGTPRAGRRAAPSAPTLFNFDGLPVRSLQIKGEPWFVAADVAAVLEYRDAFNMARMLDEDERGTRIVSTPSGPQDMTIISESGLYAAILKSRKPEAQRFRRWVTGEVLPSIRKTGGYRLDDHARRVRDVFSVAGETPRALGLRGADRIKSVRAVLAEIAPDLLHLVPEPATIRPAGRLGQDLTEAEQAAALGGVAAWFEQNRTKLLLWGVDSAPENGRVSGWERETAGDVTLFYVPVGVFRAEACKGFEHRDVLRLLDARGLIVKEGRQPKPGARDGRRFDTKAKPPKCREESARVYRFRDGVLNLAG